MKNAKMPVMNFRFDINMNGAETKVAFIGSFTYKRPTIQIKAHIGAMHTRLNGDLMNIPDDVSYTNLKLATLKFTLTEFPEWWEDAGYGADLYDQDVLDAVYQKCMDWELAFQKKVYSSNPEDLTKDNE